MYRKVSETRRDEKITNKLEKEEYEKLSKSDGASKFAGWKTCT